MVAHCLDPLAWCGSVVRTLVFWLAKFPDLCLSYGWQVVFKVWVMGQPTRPISLSSLMDR